MTGSETTAGIENDQKEKKNDDESAPQAAFVVVLDGGTRQA